MRIQEIADRQYQDDRSQVRIVQQFQNLPGTMFALYAATVKISA